jgi:hypoxanthine phosphoribosyltransferase
MVGGETILFSQSTIARRVEELSDDIAALPTKPEIAVPILTGAFMFATYLLRALAVRKLTLPMEFILLRSYSDAQTAHEMKVLSGPSEIVRDKHVLVSDGVLDSGATLANACELLLAAGARSIVAIVAVVKKHLRRMIEADHVGFRAGPDFL